MAAREKLNTVYLFLVGGVSALFGLVTKSFIVFVICFVSIIVLLMGNETIRPVPVRHRRNDRR